MLFHFKRQNILLRFFLDMTLFFNYLQFKTNNYCKSFRWFLPKRSIVSRNSHCLSVIQHHLSWGVCATWLGHVPCNSLHHRLDQFGIDALFCIFPINLLFATNNNVFKVFIQLQNTMMLLGLLVAALFMLGIDHFRTFQFQTSVMNIIVWGFFQNHRIYFFGPDQCGPSPRSWSHGPQ